MQTCIIFMRETTEYSERNQD